MPDNNSNVLVDYASVLGHRYTTARDRSVLGHQEWIDGSIEMATVLVEARDRMSDRAFGQWLHDNEHGRLSRHDREALIKLGSDPILMRTVFDETKSNSYQIIWNENRTRYPSVRVPRTTANRANTNVRPTGGGPWNNVIDDMLTVLKGRGTSLDNIAVILTEEFGITFTKGMVAGRTTRLGLSVPRGSRDTSPEPQRQRGPVAPDLGAAQNAFLTPEQIDPEFTGTLAEFQEHHGHTRIHTAEEQATIAYTALAAKLRTNVRAMQVYDREMAGSRNPISFLHPYWANWLRSPRASDTTKIAEALEYLLPLVEEAQAALRLAREVRTATPAPAQPL